MLTYSTLVQDIGRRANENPINPKTWTVPSFASAPLQVLNNEISCSSISGVNQATYTGINWPNDQWAEVRLDSLPNTGPTGVVQLRIRSSISVSTHYGLEVQGPFGPLAFLIFFSRVNGVVLKEWISISASGLNAKAINVGDVIRLEAYGNQISAKINGVTIGGPGLPKLPIIDNSIALGYPNITMTDAMLITNTRVSYFAGGGISRSWSPADSRQSPNVGILDSQGNVNYSLQGSQASSNDPVDCRATKPVDSRKFIPQNSRNSPIFG